MMSTLLTPTHFLIIAVLFLITNAVVHLLGARSRSISPGKNWQLLSRSVAGIALLCIAIGLALSSATGGDWPFQRASEIIIASAAAAILYHCLHPYSGAWERESLFYLGAAVLVMWGIARWPTAEAISAIQTEPRFWLFVSHLILALACGAFIHAGTTNLACLLTEKISQRICAEESSNDAVSLGFPLLSAFLLLTVIAGLYTRGIYWNWGTADSLQLLAWFFYAIIWCAWVVQGWRGRRIWVLTMLGMVLILLVLYAI